MKIRVTVDGRAFEVDVQDLQARPVVAVVDGEQFEVWPEEVSEARPKAEAVVPPADVSPKANGHAPATNGAGVAPAAPAPAHVSSSAAVVAPIPGVIVSVSVQLGQAVKAGQELCVLEAMKMQNVIRAPRDGVVAAVHMSAGKTVRHREPLLEYGS